MNFVDNILSSKGDKSSKRLMFMLIVLVVLAMFVYATVAGKETSESIVVALLTYSGALAGMTSYEKTKLIKDANN